MKIDRVTIFALVFGVALPGVALVGALFWLL